MPCIREILILLLAIEAVPTAAFLAPGVVSCSRLKAYALRRDHDGEILHACQACFPHTHPRSYTIAGHVGALLPSARFKTRYASRMPASSIGLCMKLDKTSSTPPVSQKDAQVAKEGKDKDDEPILTQIQNSNSDTVPQNQTGAKPPKVISAPTFS
jgi:hypothetical protein